MLSCISVICLSVNKNRCFKAKSFMESSWTNATLQRPRQVFLLKSENKFLIKCSTYHAHLVMRNEIIKKGKKEKKEGQKLWNTMCFSKEQVVVMKLEHVNKTLYALYADWNDKTVFQSNIQTILLSFHILQFLHNGQKRLNRRQTQRTAFLIAFLV